MALFKRKTADDDDSPSSWCHKKDPLALKAISAWARAKERLEQIGHTDLPNRKQAAEAAANALRVARAYRAAGEGSDSQVKAAESELARARDALEAVEGERLILAPKVDKLHEKAVEESANACARSRVRFRSEYLEASRRLTERLLDARVEVARLDAIYNAAEISSPGARPRRRRTGWRLT